MCLCVCPHACVCTCIDLGCAHLTNVFHILYLGRCRCSGQERHGGPVDVMQGMPVTWFSGGVQREGPIVAFASCHGVNTPTMVDFRLPT